MTATVSLPGRAPLVLDHLILDVNGTLTDRGDLIEGVTDRIARLRNGFDVRLLSADTFGTLGEIADRLGVDAHRVGTGADKAAVALDLGPGSCAAIGNGANDVALLDTVAFGIAVIGPEGASSRSLMAADVVCRSIVEAFDLLLDPRTLAATLRN